MIVWFAAVALSEPTESQVADRIAAVINDDVIALSEVYELGRDFIVQRCAGAEPGAVPTDEPPAERCVLEAELEVLDALIRRELTHQELSRLQLDVTAADVDQAIDRTVRQYQLADRQALRSEVEATGKRWDQYRDELFEFLRTQAFQARVLAPRVSVSEDEMRDMYNRAARKVKTPVVRVSGLGIGVPPGLTEEQDAEVTRQANELVDALNRDEIPWDEAVRLYDAGAAGMFIDQEFEPATMAPPLAEVVFAGEVGKVLAPVRMPGPSGATVLYVLRVDEREERSDVVAFEEIKEQLKEQVFQEKLGEAEEEWYQRARREAAIDVKLKAT